MSKAIAVPLDVAISSIFVQEEAVWRKTVKLLLKILGNILEKPEEAKYVYTVRIGI